MTFKINLEINIYSEVGEYLLRSFENFETKIIE